MGNNYESLKRKIKESLFIKLLYQSLYFKISWHKRRIYHNLYNLMKQVLLSYKEQGVSKFAAILDRFDVSCGCTN